MPRSNLKMRVLYRQTLKPLLGWNGARLSFLALFLVALLRVKTINLTELATIFRSNAKTETRKPRNENSLGDSTAGVAAGRGHLGPSKGCRLLW